MSLVGDFRFPWALREWWMFDDSVYRAASKTAGAKRNSLPSRVSGPTVTLKIRATATGFCMMMRHLLSCWLHVPSRAMSSSSHSPPFVNRRHRKCDVRGHSAGTILQQAQAQAANLWRIPQVRKFNMKWRRSLLFIHGWHNIHNWLKGRSLASASIERCLLIVSSKLSQKTPRILNKRTQSNCDCSQRNVENTVCKKGSKWGNCVSEMELKWHLTVGTRWWCSLAEEKSSLSFLRHGTSKLRSWSCRLVSEW